MVTEINQPKKYSKIENIFFCWKLAILLIVTIYISYPIQSKSEVITSIEQALNSQRFASYVQSPLISNSKLEHVISSDKKMNFICEDPYTIIPDSFAIDKPITFTEKSLHPVEGRWMHRYFLKRCNKKHTYNLYFLAQKDDAPKTIPMIMGETVTPFEMINDVTKNVYEKLSSIAPKDCSSENLKNNFFIKDTKILTSSRSFSREEWLATACGNDYILQVEFKFDTNGGASFKILSN